VLIFLFHPPLWKRKDEGGSKGEIHEVEGWTLNMQGGEEYGGSFLGGRKEVGRRREAGRKVEGRRQT